MSEIKSNVSTYSLIIIALIFFSLVIRIPSLFLPHIENDEVIYQSVAEKITKDFSDYSLQGTVILNQLPKALYDYPIFRHPPLFIWCIALIRLLFGVPFQILVPIFSGVLTILLTILITNRLYSRKEGLVAGMILSFCPILYFVSGRIWIDALFIFLVVLSFYLLIIAVNKNNCLWFALSGLAFGLSLLTKYTSLGGALAFVYYVWTKKIPIKKLLLFAFSFFVAAALIILPWLFLYYKVLGSGSYVSQFKLIPEITNMFPFCKTISQRPLYYYFVRLFLVAPVYIFSIAYIFTKKKNTEDYTLITWVFSFLIGFTILGMLKIGGYVLRYIAPAMPMLSILAARFISNRNNRIWLLFIILLAYGFLAGILNILFFQQADLDPVTYFMKLL